MQNEAIFGGGIDVRSDEFGDGSTVHMVCIGVEGGVYGGLYLYQLECGASGSNTVSVLVECRKIDRK